MKTLLILMLLFVVSCAGIQGRYHEVEPGDNLAKIATRYSVPLAALKSVNAEAIEAGMEPGTKLYLPFEENPEWDADELVAAVGDRAPAEEKSVGHSVTFNWPVMGLISSGYGKRNRRQHQGIDIAARTGTSVRAARSGHVIYATNKISGYGKMVIIRHADTFSTVYAHLSKIEVKKGQYIPSGAVLGRVGSTGHSTGPHLHFEVRNKRVPVDPLLYLQGQYATNKIPTR